MISAETHHRLAILILNTFLLTFIFVLVAAGLAAAWLHHGLLGVTAAVGLPSVVGFVIVGLIRGSEPSGDWL